MADNRQSREGPERAFRFLSKGFHLSAPSGSTARLWLDMMVRSAAGGHWVRAGGPEVGVVSLDLGDVDNVHVSVAMGEIWTAVAQYAEVAAGLECGLPAPVSRQIRASLQPASLRAGLPLAHPDEGLIPDCVLPMPSPSWTSLDVGLDSFRSLRSDAIEASIYRERSDPERSASWRKVMRRPRAWLHDYSQGLQDVASTWSDRSSRVRAVLSRERDRIAIAAVSGALGPLLASLSPRIRLREHKLQFRHAVAGSYVLGSRRLILTPIVAGPRMLLSTLDHVDHAWIGYPVAHPPWAPAQHHDALAVIMGSTRAAILRALDQPSSVSHLAAVVNAAVSTTSFHCDRLVDGGLVARRRQGQRVLVSRTRRGTELLDLF